MRHYLFLPSAVLVGVLFYLPSSGETEVAQVDRSAPSVPHIQVASLQGPACRVAALSLDKEVAIAQSSMSLSQKAPVEICLLAMETNGHAMTCGLAK